jgi:hypothetical protein
MSDRRKSLENEYEEFAALVQWSILEVAKAGRRGDPVEIAREQERHAHLMESVRRLLQQRRAARLANCLGTTLLQQPGHPHALRPA